MALPRTSHIGLGRLRVVKRHTLPSIPEHGPARHIRLWTSMLTRGATPHLPAHLYIVQGCIVGSPFCGGRASKGACSTPARSWASSRRACWLRLRFQTVLSVCRKGLGAHGVGSRSVSIAGALPFLTECCQPSGLHGLVTSFAMQARNVGEGAKSNQMLPVLPLHADFSFIEQWVTKSGAQTASLGKARASRAVKPKRKLAPCCGSKVCKGLKYRFVDILTGILMAASQAFALTRRPRFNAPSAITDSIMACVLLKLSSSSADNRPSSIIPLSTRWYHSWDK